MNIKTIALLGALGLLSACANKADTTGAVGGNGAVAGGTSGAVPGSEQDLVANVGDRVFYALNESTLSDDARGTLDRQSTWLGQYPQDAVQIAGNCDERGTEEFNIALGARRANAARDYLVAHGVAVLADQHDQLRQGSSDRTRLRRERVSAEPERDHLRPLNRRDWLR